MLFQAFDDEEVCKLELNIWKETKFRDCVVRMTLLHHHSLIFTVLCRAE